MRVLLFSLLIAVSCSDYKLGDLSSSQSGDDATPLPELDTSSPEELPPADTGDDDPTPIAPSAVCSVTPNSISPPFESATWIGNESFDSGGSEIISYDWQLISSPAGSSSTMPLGGANRGPFTPELAGDYIGRLVVTNDAGLTSDPCEATLEAIPAQNLWVELFWSEPQDDMDLHLLAPGGSLETRSDCYYSNCTETAQIFFPMDWGITGYTDDNPVLDLDDIPGTGPENINIASPESGGTYTVIVHDYTGSTPDVYSGNETTVNIYLDGTLAWTDTRVIEGDGSYTTFASIDWASGVISSL